MKETVIIGSVHTDLQVLVRQLPKGNEDIDALRNEQCVDGTGYHTASVFEMLGFPYRLCAVRGSGVYADFAASGAEQAGIAFAAETDELGGCTYHMRDPQGRTMAFAVPGAEYAFSRQLLADADPDDIGMVIAGGEMLSYDDGEEVIEALQELEKPVLFIPAGYSGACESYILQALFDLSPVLVLTDTEAGEITGHNTSDMKAAAEGLYAMTRNTVILLQEETGAYICDGTESRLFEESRPMRPERFGGAYAAALAAGVDEKNSIAFAAEYACGNTENAFTAEQFRRRLAGMILHR